jgi:hypothetical protein
VGHELDRVVLCASSDRHKTTFVGVENGGFLWLVGVLARNAWDERYSAPPGPVMTTDTRLVDEPAVATRSLARLDTLAAPGAAKIPG